MGTLGDAISDLRSVEEELRYIKGSVQEIQELIIDTERRADIDGVDLSADLEIFLETLRDILEDL